MPWRLLAFLIGLTWFILFLGFNLGILTDFHVVVWFFQRIPIIYLMLGSFLAGSLVTWGFFAAAANKKRLKTPGSG